MQKLVTALFAFFFILELFSAEIVFLPAILRLDTQRDSNLKNASESAFAELSAFYADENFLIDAIPVKKDGISANVNYSKSFLSDKCTETEADYLFLSEIEISTSTVVNSKVYNCKGRFVSENETIIKNNFFLQFEKHIRKTLNFLPEKRRENVGNSLESEEIIFLVDPSPAFSPEVSNLREVFRELATRKNISLGLIIPSRKTSKFFRPTVNNVSANSALENYSKEKIQLEDIRDAISRSLEGLGKNKAQSRKFIIFTGAKSLEKNFDFSDSVSSVKKTGYDVFLISGSYFGSEIFETYKRAGRKSGKGFRQLTHFQKIGTDEGLKTIFINGEKVFLSNGFEPTDRNFDEMEKVQIPPSQIFSSVNFPHAGNLIEIYESVYHKKVIEKGHILNNMRSLVKDIVEKDKMEVSGNQKKILLKSGEISIWLNVPKMSADSVGGIVTLKTVFVRNSNNSFGFSNISQTTVFQPKIAPAMLTFTPKEIIQYFRNETTNSIQCFMKGKILEIK